MRINKNHQIAIALMVSTLLLLSCFLFIWLKNSYTDQFNQLRNEADLTFISTLRTMHDSLMQEMVAEFTECNNEDTGFFIQSSSNIRTRMKIMLQDEADTIQSIISKFDTGFSSLPNLEGREMEVLVLTNSDTQIQHSPFHEFKKGEIVFSINKTKHAPPFSIQIEGQEDSLPLADVSQRYFSALKANNVGIPFQILRMDKEDSLSYSDGLTTSVYWTGKPSQAKYAAHFPNYQWHILRKIAPQILFSFFLIGLTALSFFFIYRSLLKQERLSAIRSDLVSNITHELKTPITTVGVAIEALHNFNVLQNEERTKEYLDISQNELNRLSLLVDKVLKMSMFESKEPQLNVEQLNLLDLVNEIVRSMKLQFEKVKAKVDIQTIGSNFQMEGDRMHLTSVVYNLLDNALKYSKDQPQISIELHNAPSSLKLSIADNGMGIPPQYQEKVFEKFFRITDNDQHNTKGSGLGLSYVASVIRKHFGEITLNSAPDQGSKFEIKLPRKHG